MTAPDSPAAASVRRYAANIRKHTASHGGARIADEIDGVLAELDEARRQPRVWLEGDEVPAGTWTLATGGYVVRRNLAPFRAKTPLVEVLVPDVAAAVAAERERRALDRAESPQTPSRQCATDSGAIAPQRRSEGQHGASSVEPEVAR